MLEELIFIDKTVTIWLSYAYPIRNYFAIYVASYSDISNSIDNKDRRYILL